MVRPVSLSDPAFAALRREKKEGESDSDVVLRLVAAAGRGRRDPDRFLRYRPKRTLPSDAQDRAIRSMDKADRSDPWAG